MWWKLPRSEFAKLKGEGNRQAFQAIVASGEVPGILAYNDGKPIGWCAVAPRDRYPALERSRTLKKIDDQPVWSVTCFFVAKPFRRSGITTELLRAAVRYAVEHGAQIVEGYPTETREGRAPDPFVFTGLASTFRKVGFSEVLRRSEHRPIMRYVVDQTAQVEP